VKHVLQNVKNMHNMEWIIAVNVQKLVENAPKNAGKWQRNLKRVVILMIATLFIYILTTKLCAGGPQWKICLGGGSRYAQQ